MTSAADSLKFRHINCCFIAYVVHGGEKFKVMCFPGRRPQMGRNGFEGRYVPDASREIDGSPVCHTFEQFEAWVRATYGGSDE